MAQTTVYGPELTENDPIAPQPDRIQTELKPHQRAALAKAITMERQGSVRYFMRHDDIQVEQQHRFTPIRGDVDVSTNVGVLGDIVGYGKTLTALSIIASTPTTDIHIQPMKSISVTGRNISHFTATFQRPDMNPSNHFIRTTLVVVPRGPVYVQWEQTIRTQTTLRVLALDSLPKVRKYCPGSATDIQQLKQFFEAYDIVLITSTCLKTFMNFYDRPYHDHPIVAWDRVMIDEAHVLLHKLPLYNFRFLWLITGTYQVLPSCVYGSRGTMPFILRELLLEDRLPFLLLKGNADFVMRSFSVPAPTEHYYLCEMPRSVSMVQPFLPPHILDRINANDISGAIRELGGTSETEEDIVDLVTRDIQRDINNKTREIEYVFSLDLPQEAKDTRLNHLRAELARFVERKTALAERISQLSTKTCVICYDTLTNPIMLPCTHVFCGVCIMNWMKTQNNYDASKRECPECRQPILCKRLIAVVDGKDASASAQRRPNPWMPFLTIQSKEDTLMRILMDKPDGKFLVFSRFEGGIFWRMIPKLTAANIPFAEIKGTTYQMMNIIERFRNGQLRVILLNTHYAGSGIDISCATDVVILHAMEFDKVQAVGRAQRVGRTSPLVIHNLCYAHEMDEN